MKADRPRRFTVPLLVALLLLSLWVAGGLWAFSERQQLISARESELARLTVAVEEQTLRLFKLTELSILSAANWVREHPKAFPGQDSTFIELVARLRQVSEGALDIRIVDSAGGLYMIPSASRQPVANIADRETVRAQLDPLTRGLYIGTPEISPVDKKSIITISYPVPKTDGGVVIIAAVLDLERIVRVFELQRDKPNGSIAIFKADGTTLFRAPAIEGAIGKSIAKAPDFVQHLSVVDRGQYRVKGAFDGVDRLVSHARMSSYPLIIAVTASVDDALAHLYKELIKIITLVLLVTVVTALVTRRFLSMENRSRRQLAESEQKFRSLFEHAPEAILVFDPATSRVIDANPQAEKMFQRGRDDLLSNGIERLFSPSHPGGVSASLNIQQIVARTLEGELVVSEGCVHTPDGIDAMIEVRTDDMVENDRSLIRISFIDITERKRIEEKLVRQNGMLSAIIENFPGGVSLVDAELRMLAVNEQFKRLLEFPDSLFEKPDMGFEDFIRFNAERGEYGPGDREQQVAAILARARDFQPHKMERVRSNGTALEIRGMPLPGGGFVTIYIDITERRRAEAELRIAATAFESQQGMMVTDAARVILRVNRAFSDITGYSAEEVVGQTPKLLSSGRHDATFYAAMRASITHTGGWQGEIWNRRKNGEMYPEWLTITAVKDAAGEITNYVATFADITSRKTAEEEIKNLAFYDPLTGLPNRRLLLDRLKQALASSTRSARHGALLFIDLDNFKTLNDTLGHDIGDLLLQQVAQRLVTCVREGDTVARLGGDEFVVMLEDLSENPHDAANQAETVGEKIIATFNQPYQLANYIHRGTPSIGVTLFADHQETIDELLKRADLAMYQSKAAGRNTLRFFDPEMQAVVTTRAALETGLREAVLKKQFLLHYQAQVTGEGELTGVEVLLRWQHPQRGLVSPLEFIPLAEETGLILPMGHWVLETACGQLAVWAARPEMAHLTIAVNVSPRQFHHRDFVDQVLAILDNTGANPRRLKLELTESLLVEDVEDVIAKMTVLKAKGVCFSLDDFGTGYSSLSYLKRLPLDQLKIDQGFVRDILTDTNDAAIAKMVVALAESMGLAVIAEGVEIEAQRSFLSRQGCHAYQGYLFSRPLSLEAFEGFVKRG